MQTGELDQAVTFIDDARARGANSKAYKPWTSYTTVAKVWGKLEYFHAGSEKLLLNEWPQARNVYWLIVYARDDIRAKMRALIDSRTFEIVSINQTLPAQFMSLQLVEIQ
jgi:head-tail adaptor